jgi:putative oxidoreductase
MAIFTIVITPIFHAYWGVPDAQVYMQKLNFYKNLAITGGLLAFASFGAGRFSVDARSTQRVGGMQAA